MLRTGRRSRSPGTALLFGPVVDPAGGWGVGVIEVDGEDAAREIVAADLVIRSRRGFSTELLFMPRILTRQPV